MKPNAIFRYVFIKKKITFEIYIFWSSECFN